MLRHYRNKHGITSLKRRDAVPQTEGYTPPPLTEGYTPPPPPLTEGYMPPLPPPPPPPQQQQQHPYTFTPEQQQQQQQQPYTFFPDQHEIQWKTEEPYYMIQTNNPYTFYVPDKYDPNHFMPWVHPFTSVISGPTGSGKSVFVRRFVHNIRHMMTPIPDRILWCYGEYQTLYERRWGGLSTRIAGLGSNRSKR